MYALVASHGRCHRGGCALLNLQKQRRVLDLDECVHVLEACLHERDLGLDRVVAEGDGLADDLLAARHEVSREQLDELVLYVLYEIEFGGPVSTHDEHGEEAVRLLDARVHHLHKNVGVIVEFYHQLLRFLHSTETIFVY